MNDYFLTVGLEIHAELSTKTKMFCDSKNDTDESRPNINACPICLGYPGTLPVINFEAVRKVLRLGVAVGGEIADYTEFDRKNYFYPDIPKGYQISQYANPLVKGGELAGVKLTRVHLEEDTAKSTHDKNEESLLDFNRAGIPLMELVTEPVIKTPEAAANFARELQLLLRYLDISGANMEKGEMRCEANVSIQEKGRWEYLGKCEIKPIGDYKLNPKVEIKNINSFKAVEKAINYEVERQKKELANGDKLVQETRGWDEDQQKTYSQRTKETAADYRYFPEPDIPPLALAALAEDIARSMPELPSAKRRRFVTEFGFKLEDARHMVDDPAVADFVEAAYSELGGWLESQPEITPEREPNPPLAKIKSGAKKNK